MPTEACLVHLVHSEVLVDGLDGMVIIGQQSSKSTFDANNGTTKKKSKWDVPWNEKAQYI